MTYPLPLNETLRLKTLAALGLADRDAPQAWQRICRTAQEHFDVPFAAVTLLTEHEQKLTVRCGFELDRTDRDHAFCNWTVLHDEVFVVPDALQHANLADNPYVRGNPHVRFYAGAPLVVAEDIRIGSLCLLDVRPRDFTPDQRTVLSHMAAMIVDEIWLETLESGIAFGPPPRMAGGLDLTPTTDQIRAARGMLGWSVDQLAKASGVSVATVKRCEAASGTVGRSYLDRIVAALEAAGTEFLFLPGGEPGVRPVRRGG